MPKFLTIGYRDKAGYDRTPREFRDAAHTEDAKLQSEGAVMGIVGKPVQVRNPDGAGVETREGAFMSIGPSDRRFCSDRRRRYGRRRQESFPRSLCRCAWCRRDLAV